MVDKLLCLLGYHNWHYNKKLIYFTRKCYRCNRLEQNETIPFHTPFYQQVDLKNIKEILQNE